MTCRQAESSMSKTIEIKTPVLLTEREAMLFIQFQKHISLVGMLESIDAFAIRSGSVTIHFDSMGQIGSVDKVQHYRP